MPIIKGSPPMSNTIGPRTAIVAALLSRFVRIPVRTTETNQRTIVTSWKINSKVISVFSATHRAAPVSFI